jgi:acetyltransferase-like isoleucine patch superfamily enzyme
MNNALNAYLRTYDVERFLSQVAYGYLRTKSTFARFGPLPNIRGKVRFHIRGEAVFGQRFTALGDCGVVRISVERGAKLIVGDDVAMNYGANIDVWHEVRIGNMVMMGPKVTIMDDNRHELEPGAALHKGPVVLEDNVWLAANVTILSGVTIGSGSVIGGNSVVSRDIPPNSFAAGSPARVIKTLNVPDGWSHRFGYHCNQPAPGMIASLRRTFAGDPNANIAGGPTPDRDHESVG